MADNESPPVQDQCKCRCRADIPAFFPTPTSWQQGLDQHGGKFVDLITRRWPFFAWLYKESPTKSECGYQVKIAEMHRMYMRVLQAELVEIGLSLQFDTDLEKAKKDLEPALAKYTQAVRDYEYVITCSGAYDYFVVTSERHNDDTIIREAFSERTFNKNELYKNNIDNALPTGPWEKPKKKKGEETSTASPIGLTRNDSIQKVLRHAFWRRLGAGIVGAGFLVGPMWLLALKQRLYLQLEATTGFVFGFGLVMAYFVDKIDQVFAGTLAYAAVLMVFVGLSIQG